jgi:hypothetical protein
MTMYGVRRTQAQRDAITVEIGYALFSAAFAAALVFGAVAGPALFFDLSELAETTLLRTGAAVAIALFAARVISVLLRFGRQDQPSQPGRTNPDS